MEQIAAADFTEIVSYLKTQLIITSRTNIDLNQLRRVHKVAFSIAIWDDRLSKFKEHKKVFIKQIRSNIIQSIPLVLKGYKTATALSIRVCLENLLQHIYFFDHPVEYEVLLSDKNSFLTIKELTDYLKAHPLLRKTINDTDFISKFNSNYFHLSKQVHGNLNSFRSFVRCLENLKFDNDYFSDYFRDILFLGNYSNLLLGIFHHSIYKSFDTPTRRFLISLLDGSSKRHFHQNLNLVS